MSKHIYTSQDVIKMKDAVHILRKLQERIEDDMEAFQTMDAAMSQIEVIIDTAEEEATQ